MGDFKLVKLLDAPVIINVAGGITPKGVYNALTAYVVGDMVTYGESSYVALSSTTGNLPTNPTYWMLVAQGHSNEDIQDVIGGIVTDSATIDFTYNDGADTLTASVIPGGISHTDIADIGTNTHAQIDTAISNSTSHIADSTIHFTQASISIPSTQISDFAEAVDDRVDALITDGAGITTTYNDVSNTLTIATTITQYTDELAQDAVGGILTDTASVNITYDDTLNTISAVVLPGGVDHNSLLNTHNLTTHIDHGSISGLADDDHTQYHNDTRGGARYFQKTEHLNVSAGAGDAGKPIKLDAGGHVDATMINSADVNHNATTNYVANEHINHTSVSISAGTGLSGGGDISANRTLNLADTAVTPASYGSASAVGTFTVDQQGRLTAASNTNISIASTAVSDFTEAAQDAVGAALTDTSSVDFTYNDGANTISAVVLPAGVDHNSLANLTTGDPHTQYVQAAGDTITGVMTWTKEGIQNVLTNDLSVFRQFIADDATAGGLFTLIGEPVMYGWIHNSSISNTGTTYDFTAIDETGEAAQLYVFTESGKIIYYQSTNTTGVPTFTKRWGLDISTGITDSGTNTYKVQSAVANGASAVGFEFKSNTTLSTVGHKLFSIINGATEQLWIGSGMGSIGPSNTVTGGFAFGQSNTVSGFYTTAFGFGNTVSGNGSVAAGLSNTSANLYSTAIGFTNTADAAFSVAIGTQNKSQNTYAVSIGYQNTVTASNGLALGSNIYLTGGSAMGAFAAGYQHTVGGSIGFGYGQHYPAMVQVRARGITFHDTVRFFIGDSSTTSGVELVNNGTFTGSLSGWSTTGSSWSYVSNTASNSGAGAGDTLYQTISGLVVGKVYALKFTCAGVTGTTGITPSLATSAITFNKRRQNQTTVRELFVARSTSEVLTFTADGAGGVITLDTVSVQEVTAGDISSSGYIYSNKSLILQAGTTTVPQQQFISSTKTTSPVVGALEYSNGRLWFTGTADRMVLSQSEGTVTSNTSISNSTTETTIATHTITAGEMTVGRMVEARGFGSYSKASGAHDWTFRVKIGATTIATFTSPSGAATDALIDVNVYGTCRTTGGSGTMMVTVVARLDGQNFYYSPTTASTVDTTAANTFVLTAQASAADAGTIATMTQTYIDWRN